MTEAILFMLAFALAVSAAMTAVLWLATKRANEASRRCHALNTELDRKVHERDNRIHELRVQIDHVRIERDSARGEAGIVASQRGSTRFDNLVLLFCGLLGLWAVLWLVFVAVGQ